MMRLLSILLLLAGIAVAGLGGARLLEIYNPKSETAAPSAPAPVPEDAVDAVAAAVDDAPVDADAAMEEEALPEIGEVEAAAAAEDELMAGTAAVPMARSLGSSMSDDEPMFTGEVAPSAPMSRSLGDDDAMGGVEATPEATAAAAPEADPTESFLNSLKTVPVAHETPDTAEFRKPFEAVLAIDATGDDTAADALPGRGNVQEGTARVSKRVEVRLSGSSFSIVPTTPEQQTISPLTENTWRWMVTPLNGGKQELTFDIYAIDEGPAVPLRTFHNTVTVKVSGYGRAVSFIDQANPLAVFLGGIGSILAGLFGAIKFVSKR